MSDHVGLKLVKDDMSHHFKEMLSRAQSTKASARLYPLYQKLQVQRFMSQGSSEGLPWKRLSPPYADYKKKKYEKYPGSGNKILIATGTLAGAVIGPGAPFEGTNHHVAVFKPYSMQISVSQSGNNAAGRPFNYAGYVNEERNFMKFSEKSIAMMKDALKQYLVGK